MGGQIKIAFRFADGESCCFERWTNNMGILSDLRILYGDEQPVRDYIAMTRNNDYIADPDLMGKPVSFGRGEYGFVLIDYQTKTIIDVNGYTSLFGNIHPMAIRIPQSDADNDHYLARDYVLIKNALVNGRTIFRDTYDGENSIRTAITGIENIGIINKDIEDSRWESLKPGERYPAPVTYSIDTSPFAHFSELDQPDSLRKGFQLARDIGFPFTRKDGLNTNFPFPKKKKGSETEIKARHLWMKMKTIDSYKTFDGVLFDSLSKESKKKLMGLAEEMSEDEYNDLRYWDKFPFPLFFEEQNCLNIGTV